MPPAKLGETYRRAASARLDDNMQHSRTLSLLSLFSGAGGLDIGFESTGRFETRAAIEVHPKYAETLQRNQASGFLRTAAILNEDITSLDPLETARRYCANGKVDGVIGGPPCEAFSVLGSRRGLSDPRGMLVFEFLRWVAALRPAFCLFENVPRLARLQQGLILDRIKAALEEDGYSVTHDVLNAASFGAPTNRRRLFVLAMRDVSPVLPSPTHGSESAHKTQKAFVTVSEAFAGLPAPSLTEHDLPTWHRLVRHTPAVTSRFASLSQGQRDNVRKRSRLTLDKPGPTMIAGNHEGVRTHIHPTEPRELTNRETARLHGFSDDYVFAGSRIDVCKQIANSVPIPLAEAIARSIAIQLS